MKKQQYTFTCDRCGKTKPVIKLGVTIKQKDKGNYVWVCKDCSIKYGYVRPVK